MWQKALEELHSINSPVGNSLTVITVRETREHESYHELCLQRRRRRVDCFNSISICLMAPLSDAGMAWKKKKVNRQSDVVLKSAFKK